MSLFMSKYNEDMDSQVWSHQHSLRHVDKNLFCKNIVKMFEECRVDLD